MNPNEKLGVLLINTGTPAAPTVAAVRAFLRAFLADPLVMDVPAPARWALVNLIIAPLRGPRAARAYQRIWTEDGSPLAIISRELEAGLSERLPEAEVAVAMRYGAPSIAEGLEALVGRGVNRIVAAPLFPQYAAATTASALDELNRQAALRPNAPPIAALAPFYAAPAFIGAWAAVGRPVLDAFRPDHVVLSYHGLPERHVRKTDPTGRHCLATPDCCDAIVPANRQCYRAHCFATSRALADRLDWAEGAYTVCFQSRLGRRTPWLGPPTATVLTQLAHGGVKRLAVLCPSFVVDCLETLEEIGQVARDQFLADGGEAFQLIPCLNAHPAWVDALAELLRDV